MLRGTKKRVRSQSRSLHQHEDSYTGRDSSTSLIKTKRRKLSKVKTVATALDDNAESDYDLDVEPETEYAHVERIRGWDRRYAPLRVEAIAEYATRDDWFYRDEFKKLSSTYKPAWLVQCREDDGVVRQYVVDETAYLPMHKVVDAYDITQSASQEKIDRNLQFAKYLNRYPHRDRCVVYLDSPAGLTTRILREKVGLCKNQLVIPNVNPDFVKMAGGDRFLRHAHVVIGTLYRWARDFHADSEYDLGLDYCCTFQGNAYCMPRADLKMIFRNGLFRRRGGVLWCTFSCRRKGNSVAKTQSKVSTTIVAIGRRYGYNIALLESVAYNGMVAFYFVSK